MNSLGAFAQCSQDAAVKKYKAKVDRKENVQSCSECALLALYFCSATHTSSSDGPTKNRVLGMINMTKSNVKEMGQPYCCPELLGKSPAWGSKVTKQPAQAKSSGSNPSSYSTGLSNLGSNNISIYDNGGYTQNNFDGSLNSSINTAAIGLGKTMATGSLDADFVVGVAGMAANIARENAAKKRSEEERLKRIRAENQRKAAHNRMVKRSRSMFFDRMQDSKVPLYGKDGKQYFFFYVLQSGKIQLSFSQIFELRLDIANKLPYKIDVTKQFGRQETKWLQGPFNSLSAARKRVKQLAMNANNSYVNINVKEINFTYKDYRKIKEVSSTNNAPNNNTDFWGNPTSDSGDQGDDFWGNSDSSSDTQDDDFWGASSSGEDKEVEDDFWGAGEEHKSAFIPPKPAPDNYKTPHPYELNTWNKPVYVNDLVKDILNKGSVLYQSKDMLFKYVLVRASSKNKILASSNDKTVLRCGVDPSDPQVQDDFYELDLENNNRDLHYYRLYYLLKNVSDSTINFSTLPAYKISLDGESTCGKCNFYTDIERNDNPFACTYGHEEEQGSPNIIAPGGLVYGHLGGWFFANAKPTLGEWFISGYHLKENKE